MAANVTRKAQMRAQRVTGFWLFGLFWCQQNKLKTCFAFFFALGSLSIRAWLSSEVPLYRTIWVSSSTFAYSISTSCSFLICSFKSSMTLSFSLSSTRNRSSSSSNIKRIRYYIDRTWKGLLVVCWGWYPEMVDSALVASLWSGVGLRFFCSDARRFGMESVRLHKFYKFIHLSIIVILF